jgi:predicted N-acetyltransferase YhbS
MIFRVEQPSDYWENENLTRETFWDIYKPGCNEHLALHNLRKSQAFLPQLSYVAVEKGSLVGNIVYAKLSRDGIICEDVIGFGPISVHSKWQGQGIGSKLITKTLEKAKELGYKAVLITGNTEYYARFGFDSASKFGVHLKGVPQEDKAEFFMALELEKGFLSAHPGIYEFDKAYEPADNELEEFEKHFPLKKKRKSLPGDF